MVNRSRDRKDLKTSHRDRTSAGEYPGTSGLILEDQKMSESMKRIGGPLLILVMVLFQATPVLAESDDFLKREIEAQIEKSQALQDTRINVHVQERLVVLAGQVRLYEQKLVSDRIAWTTPGVFEVDNEIRVVPKLPLSDDAIERRIRKIVSADERFSAAGLVIRVSNGKVFVKGRFLGYRDPSVLKHKVAEIEGVVTIEIGAAFLARSSETGNYAGKNHPRGYS